MNNEIFKIVGSVLLQDEEFTNGIKNLINKSEEASNKIADKFKNIGDTVTKAGEKMTLGLTTPIAGLTALGINYNMEMETLETNLATLLGSTEKASAKLEELRTMGARTPFETMDLVKATQKMLAFGIDADKTSGYLQVLGDIAMGDANKLDSLTLAFSQISASGKASMEDINQMIDQGFNPLTYVAEKTGETMAEVRDRVSEGKVSFKEIADAMKTATSEGGTFYGSMQNASETTAGRISTLKDNFNVMVGTLTESLMPTFEKIVDKLSEVVEWFSNLDEGTKETIMNVLLVVGAIGPLLIIVGKVVSAIGTVISVFTKLKTIITASATAMKVLGAVGTFLTGPVGIVIAVVGALIGIFVLLWNKCDWFREFWINLWEKIKEIVGIAVEWIKTAFNNFMEFLGTIATWINDNVIQPTISFFTALWDGIVAVFNGIKTFIENVLIVIIAIFVTAFDLITKPFRMIWDACKDTVMSVFNAIKDFIVMIWDGIKLYFTTVFNFYKAIFTTVFNAIKSVVETVVNAIKGVIEKVFNAIKSFVKTVWDGIKKYIIDPITTAYNKVKEVVGKIKDTISNTFEKVKTTVTNVFNKIKDAIWKPIETAKNKVKGFIDDIKGFFGNLTTKIKLPHFSIKNASLNPKDWIENGLPKLSVEWYAKGGIFDEPTLFNTPSGVKGVGEAGPEAVAPISELQRYIDFGNSQNNEDIIDKLDTLINILLTYLPYLMNRQQLVLDNGVLVGELINEIDEKLAKLKNRRKRG